jgi:hypothetical protein
MMEQPAQKVKLMISIVLFVLAFTTPALSLLFLWLKYKNSDGINFVLGVGEYSLFWLPVSTLLWLIAAIISPSIWLRVLSIVLFILGFGLSAIAWVFALRQAVGH